MRKSLFDIKPETKSETKTEVKETPVSTPKVEVIAVYSGTKPNLVIIDEVSLPDEPVQEEDTEGFLTLAQVKNAVPKNLRPAVTPALIQKINDSAADPEIAKSIRESFIGYTKIMEEGRFKITDYLNAVKYVSYKLMDYTNKDAYERTFPEKIVEFHSRGMSDRDIAPYIASYHKGKLVNLIMEQSLTPFHVLNQEYRQKAVNRLVRVMSESQSDKAVVDAASALLTHLAPPKDTSLNLNINTTVNKETTALQAEVQKLAELQRQAIIDGTLSTKAVAESRLIKSEDDSDADDQPL